MNQRTLSDFAKPFSTTRTTPPSLPNSASDPIISGAPSYVHGGVQLALLDEAMDWASIAIAGQFAVTASFGSTFHHPLKIDRHYRLQATINSRTDSTLTASSVIVDDQQRVRTSADATLVVLSAAQAVEAGTVMDESTKRYTRW